ncbi:MAG: hypothetical protein JW744_02840 [Candidatus Diapherotrites archaeon]|uniref:Protein-export membrane protein SecF n=1 Tax=Candidatus Iainarchaeum sp. TaxID=3101447 RepID=A0A938YX02_9ARCH|nr:hypothetical protein [Candidatus Diapherotrites archaeon]
MKLGNFYASGNTKRYLLVPLALFLVFLFLILVWPTVPRGIDLKGGTLLLIRSDKEINASGLKDLLSSSFDLTDLSVHGISSPSGFGVNVQFASNNLLQAARDEIDLGKAASESSPETALQHYSNAVSMLAPYLEETSLSSDADEALGQSELYLIEATKSVNEQMQSMIVERFSLGSNVAFQRRDVSPTLGESFWQTAFNVAIFAAVLIVLVVFLFFRKVIPSAAVIAAAVFDIAGALALMAVFGIPLSLSSIPALLMLIGYSVDTDIMLTTRMLTRGGKEPSGRAYESMLTGLTMTGTTIAALIAMIAISYLNQIEVIFAIAVVLFFGLAADLVSTWLMNAPILLWYVEGKRQKTFM